MAFTLDAVVPWGRSFDEYAAMFALTRQDLGQRILGCGDGPASFNALLTRQGGAVVSVDPLYRFSAGDIRARIRDTYETVMAQTRRNRHEFVWRHIPSVEELGHVRMQAMDAFLDDYPTGRREGRYIAGELPGLPCREREFDVAVCSHFLFLYSEHYSAEFHLHSIRELCRAAREVRIFPLLELGAKPSRHLDAVLDQLQSEGFRTRIETADYEFQRGGNQLLRVSGP